MARNCSNFQGLYRGPESIERESSEYFQVPSTEGGEDEQISVLPPPPKAEILSRSNPQNFSKFFRVLVSRGEGVVIRGSRIYLCVVVSKGG